MANNVQYSISLNTNQFETSLARVESQVSALEAKLKGFKMGGIFGSGGEMKSQSMAAGVFFGNAAFAIIKKGVNLLGSWGKSVMEGGMELQKTKTAINVLAGEGGPKLFDDLREYMLQSTLGPEIFDVAKKMMSYGFRSEELMPFIKTMADITMGDENKMGRMAYALSEIRAGKFLGQEINQLVSAGLPVEEMGKLMGLSAGEFRKAVSEHKVNINTFLERFSKMTLDPRSRYYGMQEEFMKTPAGKVEQLKENWSLFKKELGLSIAGTKGFNKFLETLQRFRGADMMGKLTDLGEKVFLLLNRLAIKFEYLIDRGYIDSFISGLGYVVDHLEEIVITFGTFKAAKVITDVVKGLRGLLSIVGLGGTGTGLLAVLSEVLLPLAALTVILISFYNIWEKYLSALKNSLVGRGFKSNEELSLEESGKEYMADVYAAQRKQNITDFETSIDHFIDLAKDKNLPAMNYILGKPMYKGDIIPGQISGKDLNIRELYSKLGGPKDFDKFLTYLKGKSDIEEQILTGTADVKKIYSDFQKSESALSATKGSSDLFKTKESRVRGIQPINININIENMIRDLFYETISPKEDANRVKEAMIGALTDAINTAQGYALNR